MGAYTTMGLMVTLSITAVTVLLCVMLHFEVAIRVSRKLEYAELSLRKRFLILMFAMFGAHVAEMGLFTFAIALLLQHPESGVLGGSELVTGVDYIYVSALSYTTLGYADITPEGPMRILTSIEGLLGFMLLTWSASLTFLQMQQHWAVGGE
ncbi:ion channel [Vreelandella rituensis]|uniref:Two pore domain potassium channel family protein n=1 Tax=Vreelandella rituensis TaxID=2282306 RepID=A0A368TN24_9GAMM|nr:ion channel [Halomonas rituensis]RCV85948.1 two pore domain potassium channel family protein [Halomonas rituensis]